MQAPVNQGQAPVNQGQAPVNQGQAPVNQGQAPVNQGQAPVNQGQAPVNQGQAPVNQGQAPVNQGQAPVNQGQQGAVLLNGQDPQNLFVDRNRVLYICNLPLDSTVDEINRFFGGYAVEHIRIILTASGNHSGTALVQFTNPGSANAALQQLQRQKIRDWQVFLNPAIDGHIQSYRDGRFCGIMHQRDRDYEDGREFQRQRDYYNHFNHRIDERFDRIDHNLREIADALNMNFGLLNQHIQFRQVVLH